jgi:hypothetical protein
MQAMLFTNISTILMTLVMISNIKNKYTAVGKYVI